MTGTAPGRRRLERATNGSLRFIRRLLVIALLAALAYPCWLGFRIYQQSHRNELHTADAIVVLGAAQYNGRPSPVLKARLDHAVWLYRQGYSKVVVTTGGKQPGDNFTEAEAGRRYLEEHGVSASVIMSEDTGRTTLQSLRNVAAAVRPREFDSLLLVSDPLHSERIKRIALDEGFEEAYTSPASYVELNRSRETKIEQLLHEIGSLMAYELLER
ncbi:MAG TPA: YdcF family protein [Actinomycetota bacterium]|nr:YdcF family protein [Actinomycetota bacterium]